MGKKMKDPVLSEYGAAYSLSAFEKLLPEVQTKILDAAAGVFAEEGYHYASVGNICRRAGISNGALYKYFKNKEALFLAVVDYSVKMVETDLYQKYISNSESLLHSVRNLLHGMIRFTETRRDYISIYCDLGSSSMNRFAAVTAEKYRRVSSVYTLKMVAESQKRNKTVNIQNEVIACLIDNYLTLFAYSLVSEYHANRFNSFFTGNRAALTRERQIEIIIESLRQVLRAGEGSPVAGPGKVN
jgi:TetR/AcrR family transcriptional regulator